jgi:formylglycine-generating enzyme required for sulfatase activity
MQQLIEHQNADLQTLAKIAGFDPATDLVGADFRGADFSDDDLAGFNLSRSDLRGADLSGARGLDRAMFADVIEDATTRWPDRHTPLPGTVLQEAREAPEMVLIPPGRFVMGTPDAEDARERVPEEHAKWSKPQHEVIIRDGFWLAKYLVTRGEFAAFVADTGHDMSGGATNLVETERNWQHSDEFGWRNTGFEQTDHHPVVCVSHQDAEAYAAWLSRRTSRHYRLPSEAEWEYAARAGTGTARFWGDERNGARQYANVADRSLAKRTKVKAARERFLRWDDGYPFTSPVGSFHPNGFGLYDVLGNVWEWAADHWHDDYADAPKDGLAWMTDRNDSRRVLRGGSWYDPPRYVRAGVRIRDKADLRYDYVGFRLARTR